MQKMSEFQSFGYAAEQAFQASASGLGYQVGLYSADFRSEFDFLVDGVLPVEVKSARPRLHLNRRGGSLRWRWQFNVSSCGSDPGRRDFLLVLACWLPAQQDFDFFLIPSAYLLGRPFMMQITTNPVNYRGWMARFYHHWQVVDMLSSRLRGSVNYSLWGLK